MLKRLTTLFIGNTLAALCIAMVINSGLGCFAVTSTNLAIANFFNISLGTAGMLFELAMLLFATYKGEGIGVCSVAVVIYGIAVKVCMVARNVGCACGVELVFNPLAVYFLIHLGCG